ncbi:MAG: hypothetical protein AAF849_05155 [Bacteroidota bacterium]
MMIKIEKSEIIDLMVAHYKSQLKESTYQMYHFQQQYNCSLQELEQKINDSKEEVFGIWEDYISWRGHQQSAHYLIEKIQKIEHGLFEVT